MRSQFSSFALFLLSITLLQAGCRDTSELEQVEESTENDVLPGFVSVPVASFVSLLGLADSFEGKSIYCFTYEDASLTGSIRFDKGEEYFECISRTASDLTFHPSDCFGQVVVVLNNKTGEVMVAVRETHRREVSQLSGSAMQRKASNMAVRTFSGSIESLKEIPNEDTLSSTGMTTIKQANWGRASLGSDTQAPFHMWLTRGEYAVGTEPLQLRLVW